MERMMPMINQFHCGDVVYLNDDFYKNVKIRLFGLMRVPDPKRRDGTMILMYQGKFKMDGFIVQVQVEEQYLSTKPVRR